MINLILSLWIIYFLNAQIYILLEKLKFFSNFSLQNQVLKAISFLIDGLEQFLAQNRLNLNLAFKIKHPFGMTVHFEQFDLVAVSHLYMDETLSKLAQSIKRVELVLRGTVFLLRNVFDNFFLHNFFIFFGDRAKQHNDFKQYNHRPKN